MPVGAGHVVARLYMMHAHAGLNFVKEGAGMVEEGGVRKD